MIYTLTLNPCIDHTVYIEEWERGEINRSQSEVSYPGGKGINVSIVLTNLMAENTALGFVGGFTGKEIVRLVENKGVKTDFITVEGNSRINVKIMSNGETQFNGAGPTISQSAQDELDKKLQNLKKGDYLVMAGSIPSSLNKDYYENIIEKLEGKGVNFVIDATKELLTNTLKYKPFLIKPNHHELGEIFNKELTTVDEVIEYGKKLQGMGAKNIIVSMGGMGAVLIPEKGKATYCKAPEGKVVDTVGAGDSTIAGFLSEYIAISDMVRAFYRGVATGSATAFSKELATKAESDALFEKML